jgi:glycosyltransferase involved in cell wall biosynthesis
MHLRVNPRISIVLPTHRASYSAIARIFELASLDSDRFEVVVRDNSEDDEKRRLLMSIKARAVRIESVPNRGPFENPIRALKSATGEFAMMMADDDWISPRGLATLHELLLQHENDAAVACLSGTYLMESSFGSGFFRYSGLDAIDPIPRLNAYISANAPNVIYYSAVRRDLLLFCFDILERLPYRFSYHDQLISMLILAQGRVEQTQRVVYSYDLGEWETFEKSLAKDRAMYAAAGIPAEFDRLHWLLCGLEGALLIKSRLLSDRIVDPTELSNVWFSGMFYRFKHHAREIGYQSTPLNAATMSVRDKYVEAEEINVNELLLDVCNVIELVDKNGSDRYFNFWSSV